MKFIHKAEEALLVTLFLVAVVVLTAQILSRYVLPYPLPWTCLLYTSDAADE